VGDGDPPAEPGRPSDAPRPFSLLRGARTHQRAPPARAPDRGSHRPDRPRHVPKATAAGDDDLIEIAAKATRATICLRSALARHDLTDDIPSSIDIALPRHTWPPATRAPVTWHQFNPRAFDIGRATLRLDDDREIGIYSLERCIIDAYRLRHLEGAEMANQALRRWLRQGGQPSILLRLAEDFPTAQPAIRRALEILL